jgi:hypothetical protein
MDAPRAPGDCRFRAFAVKIEPVLLSVCSPTFFKIPYVLGLPDVESLEGQDHGANADARLRAFSNVPTSRTPQDRRADVPAGSNPLQHCVQVVAQIDECVEGHARLPLGTQPRDHFREPDSLRVTGGHV